jgi:Na+/proline symporter
MRSRLAATVLLSIGVFIVVTLLVSLGVLWWTGDATRGIRIGVICGAVAVITVSAVSWAGRTEERSDDEHERSRGGRDR